MRSALLQGLVLGLWLKISLVSGQNGSAIQNETFDGEVEQSYFLVNSAFGILRNDIPAQALDLPTGTCNDKTPCVNGACCSSVSSWY